MLSGWLNLKSQNLMHSEDKAYKMDPNVEEIRMWLSEGQTGGGVGETREACQIWDCPRAQRAFCDLGLEDMGSKR